MESFVVSKGDTDEGKMAKEYVSTLRYLSDLNYPFDVICAFDAATRGRWRAANKTTVDRNALCVDFLLRRGVEGRESEPAPEYPRRENHSFDRVCKLFNESDGCQYGNKCRFKHKCSKCGNSGHGSFKCTK